MWADDKNKDDRAYPHSQVLNICLVAGFLYIYQLLSVDGLYKIVLSNLFNSPTNFLFYFVNYFILPPALLLLIKKQKSGWFLTAFYLVYMAVSGSLIFAWQLLSVRNYSITFLFMQLYLLLGPALVYSVLFFFLCKRTIAEIFNISLFYVFSFLFISILGTVIATLYTWK